LSSPPAHNDHDHLTHSSRVSEPFTKMVIGIALFFTICVIAVTGYTASGWELDDAIYMVIITVFGVGYGEVRPIQSPGLRALTIMVIIAGYGAVIYTVGGFMQMLIDGELKKALGARRMAREIDRLQGHVIICGIGRVGTILARELHRSGKPFVVVDRDELRLQAAADHGYLIVHGDATEEDILNQAGIDHASMLATVLSDDAKNVFVTITARAMNPRLTIIARGENPRTERKLLGCGANQVVLPSAIGAQKVAQLIIRPSAESLLAQLTTQSDMNEDLQQLGLQFYELSVPENSPLVEQPLRDMEIRGNHSVVVVAVRDIDGHTTLQPDPTFTIRAGTTIIVLGHKNDIPKMAGKLAVKSQKMTYRGVQID